MPSELTFRFEGHPVAARTGQSIAAALTAAGHRVFRETAKGAQRGMFCGMGVCQDCLVSVDGAQNLRACMTPVEAGAEVRRQVPLPKLTAATTSQTALAEVISPEVLIVGGGAGGLNAAIVAARAGASVVVLDERKVPGGQYYKQPADCPVLDRQQAGGASLLEAARGSGATILGGVEVWGAFDGPLILAERNGGALVARPKKLIVATGAYERPAMVPGWTLPGVMTTGAAQTLWRSYRTLPGRSVAVCGSGPLNLQVALELAQGGAEVALVAEAAPSPLTAPLAALGLVLAGPTLSLKGAGLIRGLRGRRIPIRYRTVLSAIEAAGEGLRLTFEGPGGAQQVTVDALCMNYGFEPQNEILRLLGAAMHYDPAFGHLRCQRFETMETSVPGVFAVGDCAGLGGAPAAETEGRIAGAAAAAACGHGDGHDLFADQRALVRHRRFQRRLWALHAPAPHPLTATDETIICRCEEVTLAEMRAAMGDHAGHVGTVKRVTRLGMGSCQGRYCGPVAVRLLAARRGKAIEDLSFFAPRVPIKPVAISTILAAQEALDAAD
jgi:D-hydroxyproline dehydrogenase subunit alpha